MVFEPAQNPDALRGDWSYPTAIRFGPGRIAELPDVCRSLGITHPLLVTDPGLSALPIVREAVAHNEDAGLSTAVFSDLRSNPVRANVDAGVAMYRAAGHDGVIGFGGGSALDVAKVIALLAHPSAFDWDGNGTEKQIPAEAVAPVIAVPTTAGTGSEVGRAAVVTYGGVKKILLHPRMMPRAVIADPQLTLSLPPHLTAWTGMDALAHCLEAYCGAFYHPMADGIALEGLRLIHTWLPVAVREGDNLVARAHMMAAATMGAAAFQKALGAVHALSHPLGAVYDLHHGLTNAVVMPYVLVLNRPAIEEKMALLARFLNLPDEGFEAVLDWILDLRRTLDIPHTLAELGIEADQLEALAIQAAADPNAEENPVPVDAVVLAQCYRDAMAGRVIRDRITRR